MNAFTANSYRRIASSLLLAGLIVCIALKITPVNALPFTSSTCMSVYEKAGYSEAEALEHCTVNIPDSFEASNGSDTAESIDSAKVPSFKSFDECRSHANELGFSYEEFLDFCQGYEYSLGE